MTTSPPHVASQISIEEAIRLAQETGVIPLAPPSTVKSRKVNAKPLVDNIPSSLGDIDQDGVEGVTVEEIDLSDFDPARARDGRIPSGAPSLKRGVAKADGEPGDEIFDASMLVIPLSALFLLLDILAHKQYDRHPPGSDYVRRLVSAVPTIAILVFLTNRFPTHPLTYPSLMIASVLCGGRLLWLVNKSSYLVVMDQAPPIGTLWIFTVIQLPLGRCLIALGAMLGWCWWAGMKFRP